MRGALSRLVMSLWPQTGHSTSCAAAGPGNHLPRRTSPRTDGRAGNAGRALSSRTPTHETTGTAASAAAVNQETIDETGEGQRQEQRSRDGIELPALGRDLPHTALQQQRHAADDEVQQHHLQQAHCQRLALGAQRPQLKPAGVEERQIGCHKGSRSEEHTSELQSPCNLVCRLLLEKKKT